mgnify:CR=1 FL=1
MSIPFANFDPTSPLSTSPHDPMLSLASNCIRDAYGPTVQMVADGLIFRGGGEPCSWNDLVRTLREKTRQKHYSQERIRLLGPKVAHRLQNQSLQLGPLRAALLVLVQHSIVKVVTTTRPVNGKQHKNKVTCLYQLDRRRARLLPRYPRFVEYAKRALDSVAAALVEELLVQGRLRTVDAVQKTLEQLQSLEGTAEGGEAAETPTPAATTTTTTATKEEEVDTTTDTPATVISTTPATATTEISKKKEESLKAVLEAFKRLTAGGFLEQVPKIQSEEEANGEGAEEFEFEEEIPEPPNKKARFEKDAKEDKLPEKEDETIVAKLQSSSYKSILPRHAVWRVNMDMFHDSLRAFSLGRLVSERYGHKVQSAGSMVTAALKYLAQKKFAEKQRNTKNESENNPDVVEDQTFDAASILRYMPRPVLALLEKKGGGDGSTGKNNISVASQVSCNFQQLAAFQSPSCILEVEVGAKPEDSKFQINTLRLVQYMQSRITHQIIVDHQGEVAARIVTILTQNGLLESDSLAEAAMVPAKDTREVRYESRSVFFEKCCSFALDHPHLFITVPSLILCLF